MSRIRLKLWRRRGLALVWLPIGGSWPLRDAMWAHIQPSWRANARRTGGLW